MGLLDQLFARSQPVHGIAIDLGSDSFIRSALFNWTAHDAVMVRKERVDLPRRNAPAERIPAVANELRRIMLQYLRAAGRVPNKALIGLGGALAQSRCEHIEIRRAHPRDPLQVDEIHAILRDFIQENSSRMYEGGQWRLLHAELLNIAVDGYRIPRLGSDTRGTVIEANIFATYVPVALQTKLEEARSHWSGIAVGFTANHVALAEAAMERLGEPDMLLVKIGSAATEVTVASGGIITAIGSFDAGGNSFTAAIAKRFHIPFADAEVLKRQRHEVVLSPTARQRMDETLTEAADAWTRKLAAFLHANTHDIVSPRIFLCGGASRIEAIRERMLRPEWMGQLTFATELSVSLLTAEQILPSIFRFSTPPVLGPDEAALASLTYKLMSPDKYHYELF